MDLNPWDNNYYHSQFPTKGEQSSSNGNFDWASSLIVIAIFIGVIVLVNL